MPRHVCRRECTKKKKCPVEKKCPEEEKPSIVRCSGIILEAAERDFGPGTAERTICQRVSSNLKIVFGLSSGAARGNTAIPGVSHGISLTLFSVNNLVDGYDYVNGLDLKKGDYELAVVALAGGVQFLLNNNGGYAKWVQNNNKVRMQGPVLPPIIPPYVKSLEEPNPVRMDSIVRGQPYYETYYTKNGAEDLVKALISRGVKIYACQVTMKGQGIKTEDLIEGVNMVQSGVMAIANFSSSGWETLYV
jgi:intracellular sulfur oxidation DsrE/DsrF family protein